MTEDLPQNLEIWQDSLNWQPTRLQLNQFQVLYELILKANQQLNLTRITEINEFWEKHLWDSIFGIKPYVNSDNLDQVKVIDIGTGGGFPGLPLAIVMPHWQFTLVDSTAKKINFIRSILTPLALENATAIAARIEGLGQDDNHREQYDLAVIRAVANVSVCAEYTLPLLAINGQGVFYRGNWTVEEETALTMVLGQLGGVIEDISSVTTPISQSVRHCIYIRKDQPTPREYPRAIGVPTQQPLF
jgi:16S rRNA (guanine527-N7)-methyltransferase